MAAVVKTAHTATTGAAVRNAAGDRDRIGKARRRT
jgi:hypothetical protein